MQLSHPWHNNRLFNSMNSLMTCEFLKLGGHLAPSTNTQETVAGAQLGIGLAPRQSLEKKECNAASTVHQGLHVDVKRVRSLPKVRHRLTLLIFLGVVDVRPWSPLDHNVAHGALFNARH